MWHTLLGTSLSPTSCLASSKLKVTEELMGLPLTGCLPPLGGSPGPSQSKMQCPSTEAVVSSAATKGNLGHVYHHHLGCPAFWKCHCKSARDGREAEEVSSEDMGR